MAERVRWRQKHDALHAEHERLEQDFAEATAHNRELSQRLADGETQLAELTKAVERARLQGMHDVTSLLLRGE